MIKRLSIRARYPIFISGAIKILLMESCQAQPRGARGASVKAPAEGQNEEPRGALCWLQTRGLAAPASGTVKCAFAG